jgi:FixJ family two-component response regulator
MNAHAPCGVPIVIADLGDARMHGSESRTIVIVEDDPSMSRALARILRLGGIATRTYVSGEALLANDDLSGVECLIVDVQLPEMSGFELRTRAGTMVALPPVIFITAFDSPEARAQALAAGAAGFLPKPFSGRTLLETVRQVTKKGPTAGGTDASARGRSA